MMLVICLSCQSIIGCGVDKDGVILNYCSKCSRRKECLDSSPIGFLVQRKVFFVKFPNGCSDHGRVQIGF